MAKLIEYEAYVEVGYWMTFSAPEGLTLDAIENYADTAYANGQDLLIDDHFIGDIRETGITYD